MTTVPPLHLFFARADNDLDHLTPVMWSLLQRGASVRLISRDPLRDLTKDYRVTGLQSQPGFSCATVFGMASPPRTLAGQWHRLYWSLVRASEGRQREVARIPTSIAASRITGRLVATRDRVEQELDPRTLLTHQGRMAATLSFDHYADGFTRRCVEAARAAGIPSLALPHSIGHLASGRTGGAFRLREPHVAPGTHVLDSYDHVAVPNALVAARLVRDGLAPSRITVRGSARFSASWLPQLRAMMPTVDVPARTDGRHRLLFLTSKFLEHVNRDEVYRVMRAILADGRFELWIKPHTRTAYAGLPADISTRAYIAPSGVPTFALVDRADAVLFWGTSAIYDALVLETPVIYLKYLFTLETDLDPLLPTRAATSRDSLARLLDDLARTPHGARERDGDIRARVETALVSGGHPDPLKAIANLYDEVQA